MKIDQSKAISILTGIVFLEIITQSKSVSSQRIMDNHRSTIGNIEEGRVLNEYRATTGYFKKGRILKSNRATLDYVEKGRVLNAHVQPSGLMVV